MRAPYPQIGRGDGRLPAPNPLVIALLALLWLTFACVLPIRQVRQARRQAHQELLNVLVAGKPDAAGLLSAFDQANQNLDTVAAGPCVLLAVTIVFLLRQLLRLKRRYNAVELDLKVHRDQSTG